MQTRNKKKQRFENLSGKITLRTVYAKEQRITVTPVIDDETNWYKGIDRLSEEQKRKMDFFVDEDSVYILTNGATFDLDDKVGRMNWDWIQWCKEIAEDFAACQKSPGALLYIDNEIREASKSLGESDMILKAMTYVNTDKPANLKARVRLLGMNMEEDSDLSVKNYMMNMAKKIETAQKVINVFENNDLGVQLLFLQARDKGIVKKQNGAFLFGDMVLGISEESVLEFLKDVANKSVVDQISKEANPELYKAGGNQ